MLDEERQYFEAHRNELVGRYNQLFVLIKGTCLVGAFPSAGAAYEEGVKKFGAEPFLVKQVLENEPLTMIQMFSVSPRAYL